MYRKLLLKFLTLLIFLFVPVCFADVNPAGRAARNKIFSLIDAGNYKAAELATNKMITDFAGNDILARRLWEVANRYDKVEAFEQAGALSSRIAADYPKDIYAKYASLLLAKLRIYELIEAGDYEAAYSAIPQVMKDFAVHKQLARRLWEIANRYDKFNAFGYAKTLSGRIAADYPRDTYAGYASLLLAKLKVFELIDTGKYESADLAVAAMTRDFADYGQLSRRLYEIAQRYAENQAWTYAKLLHGRIAADYPNDKYGPRSAIRHGKLKIYELINAGDYEAADKTFLQMKADFVGNSELYNQLGAVGERYEIAGQNENAQRVYQQIIRDCPAADDSAIFAKAQLKKYEVVSMAESGDYAAADAAAIQFGSEFTVPQQRCAAMFYLAKGLCEKASADQNDARVTNYLNRIIAIQENEVIGRIGRGPVELEAYLILATAYERLGRYDRSIEYCSRVLNTYPEYEYGWHIQFMVGQNYEKMLQAGRISQPQAATQIKTAYQKVLHNYPDCRAAKLAKKWLDRNGS